MLGYRNDPGTVVLDRVCEVLGAHAGGWGRLQSTFIVLKRKAINDGTNHADEGFRCREVQLHGLVSDLVASLHERPHHLLERAGTEVRLDVAIPSKGGCERSHSPLGINSDDDDPEIARILVAESNRRDLSDTHGSSVYRLIAV